MVAGRGLNSKFKYISHKFLNVHKTGGIFYGLVGILRSRLESQGDRFPVLRAEPRPELRSSLEYGGCHFNEAVSCFEEVISNKVFSSNLLFKPRKHPWELARLSAAFPHMCQEWLHAHNTCFQACPGMGSSQVLTFSINIQNSQLPCLLSSTYLLYVFILSLSLQIVHFSPILRVDMATLTGSHPSHTLK